LIAYVFDVTKFRLTYPAFADPLKYPDALLQQNFDFSGCYVTNDNYGWLRGDCRYNALTLMTAHLTALYDINKSGQIAGQIQDATIDKISVSLTPPPNPNEWQWWLSQTGYGQQLLALLQVNSAGGFYIGGLPEKSGFRKVGGIF
jgi:uncharacterized protein DUF4054